MFSKSFTKKLLSLLLGFFFALVIVETSLRVLGFVENFKRNTYEKSTKSRYTILCIGNSYTAGFGAPRGKDYPSQLKELLVQKKINNYRVINRGKGNVNTSYLMEHLPTWLKEDRPDMVFVMTGEPNSWNKYNYWKYLEENHLMSSHSFTKYFQWSKVYRLVEIFFNKQENSDQYPHHYSGTFKSVSLNEDSLAQLGYLWLGHLERDAVYPIYRLTKEQADEAIKALDYIYKKDSNPMAARLIAEINLNIKKNYKEFNIYIEKSFNATKGFNYELWKVLHKSKPYFYRDKELEDKIVAMINELNSRNKSIPVDIIENWYGSKDKIKIVDRVEKIEFLHKLSFLNPSDPKILEELYLYDAPPEIVIDVAERSGKVNPISPSSDILGYAQKNIKGDERYNARLQKLIESTSKLVKIPDLQSVLSKSDLEREWIIHDLEVMIKDIKSSNAKVVIQTYPPYRKGNPRFADTVLRSWWQGRSPDADVKFLDVGLQLKDLLSSSNKGEQYYSTEYGPEDEHLGSSGNFEVAKLMVPYVP